MALGGDPDAPRVEVGALDGAVFALLGLLIAFTFSGAASRWDTRRQLVVEEANAIGTAYLRLDVLPPDAQPALREQFRQYVDARLAAYRSFPDVTAVKAELARSVTLQGEIWAQAVAACRSEGSQPARMLVLPALNAMIDITTTRTVAAQTHPPSIVYAMLVVLMLVSSLLAGHRMAEGKKRSWIHMVGFALTMAFALYVIVDLEFPRRGPHPSRRLRPAAGRRAAEHEVRRTGPLAAILLASCACATPIGVTHVDTQSMYHTLTANVLSADRPSPYSEQLLRRLGIDERFAEDPELVLAALRGPGTGLSREYLFVLSELSFYHAVKSQKPEYFLASAIYAYAFAVGPGDGTRVEPIDPRLRLAANLYNLGLAQGFASGGEEAGVAFEPGSRPLPFGQIEISVDDKTLLWSGYRMVRFVSLGEFKVRGFLNRYRQAGIGAPLAAELAPASEGPQAAEARKRILPQLKVPVTAVLRIKDVSEGIATGDLKGRIEVYAADSASTVEIGGRSVPPSSSPRRPSPTSSRVRPCGTPSSAAFSPPSSLPSRKGC